MHSSSAKVDVLLLGRLSGLANELHPMPSARQSLKLWTRWPQTVSQHSLHHVIIFSYLRDLADKIEEARCPWGVQKRFVLFQDETPIESAAQLLSELDVRSSSRLHVAHLVFDTEQVFVQRFLSALSRRNDQGAIVDAWWDGDDLVVLSPDFERLRIPAGQLPKLRGAGVEDRSRFDIDPLGAYIYWPSHDVHLGWSQFKQIVDPAAFLRARQRSEQFNVRYGQAIRVLRQELRLKQSDVPGLDERTVRRIEKGQTRATSKALACLAKAHGMDASRYMNELARRLVPQTVGELPGTGRS